MEKFIPHIKQFIKFGIIGVSNTLISLGVYYLLYFLGINYLIANTSGFIISVLNSYYWNNKFVFKKTSKGHIKALIKTYISYGSTFLVSMFLLFILVQVFNIPETIAPIICISITIPFNFLINKFWAFK